MKRSCAVHSLIVGAAYLLHLQGAYAGDSIVFPSEENANVPANRASPKPRFGDHSFNAGPDGNGGFSGAGSFSNNMAGNGHASSNSNSFSFSTGGGGGSFSASQSASQSASFNHPGYSHQGAGLASSQSASFSGAAGGGGTSVASSAASSQAASLGFNGYQEIPPDFVRTRGEEEKKRKRRPIRPLHELYSQLWSGRPAFSFQQRRNYFRNSRK